MIPAYDYHWRAMRRTCDILSDDTVGVGAELADLVAADPTLDGLSLPTPKRFIPFDREAELADISTAEEPIVCLWPGPERSRVQMLGDDETRTDEVVWDLMVAVRLIVETGNAPLVESWDTVDHTVRERRRIAVVLGAIANVMCRSVRDGVNVISVMPADRPEHGVQVSDESTARWARQPFSTTQHVLIPQFATG